MMVFLFGVSLVLSSDYEGVFLCVSLVLSPDYDGVFLSELTTSETPRKTPS
jgi:hypothetical protein